MSGLDLKNSFTLQSAAEVSRLCSAVLNSIGITYFNYIKIYNRDSSRELLTNNAEWIDHFYKKGLYASVGAVDIEHLLPKGYFLWSELNSDDPIYSHGRESFNIDNGISFVIKREDVTYLYIFASSRDNHKINNFYLRNIDLLQRFILYFNDKGSALMKIAENNRIYLPDKQVIIPERIDKINPTQEERTLFYKQTKIDKFYLLSESDDLYLTEKQAECVAYIAAGATAKQCAKGLNISYRTVEGYIDDIKAKIVRITGSKLTKDELIIFLKKTDIHNVVFPDKIKIYDDE